MRQADPSLDTRADYGAIDVARPRRTDAIGSSLRHAFDRDYRMPADLCSLLRALGNVR